MTSAWRAAGHTTTTAIRRVIEEGKPAPTFTLPSDSGEDVSLESFRARPVVRYSYPKDDTPGRRCSNEWLASATLG